MALGRQCNASIYTQQTAQTSKSHNKNENCNFYDSRESAAVARSRKKSELYGSEISLIVNFKPNSKKRENSAIKKTVCLLSTLEVGRMGEFKFDRIHAQAATQRHVNDI